MISRNSGGGFFAAHWDWLVAAVGVVALVVGVALFVMTGGGDPEENASAVVNRLKLAKKADTGVKAVDMTPYERALQFAVKPPTIAEVADEGGNFLVSERRIFCQVCKKPIKDGTKVCPLCGEAQPEPEKPVADADSDGLPDDWEKKYGLDVAQNDADADKDGDGFTNAEEFAAGTDPADKLSHPDYFASLKVVLPLKETVLPFYLRSYMKTPSGMKLEFFDPKRRNDYGKNGYRYSVLVGEAIGDTGFTAKSFEQKEKKAKIKGSNVERTVDVSAVTIVRKADGKNFFSNLLPVKGFILGYFGKDGKATHVLVVNLDYNATAKTRLTASAPLQRFAPHQALWVDCNANYADLELPPGGGILFRIKN